MGMWIFGVMASSFVLTIVFEVFFTFVLGVRKKKDMLLVVLVNVLTNPFVVSMYYVNMYYIGWNSKLVTAFLEISAVLIEGFCYKKYCRNSRHPFFLSLGANAFSYCMGLLVNLLFL